MDENAKNQIQELTGRLEQIESTLNSARKILKRLETEYLKVDYTQIEGIVGKYDGKQLITEAGEKYEVPSNYAAKSKLVYGDILKLIEEDGKKLFKQIERVRKERVEGILTKKDGEWFLLTDRGSYKVSEAAAKFQNAQLNSQATAYLPADNMDAPFAALDVVEGASVIGTKPTVESAPEKREKRVEEKIERKVERKVERRAKPTTAPVKKKEENLKGFESKEINLKKEPKKKIVTERKPASERSASERPARTSKPRPVRTSKPAARPRPRAPAKKPDESREEAPKSRAAIEDDDLV